MKDLLVISGSDPLDGASIRRHASFDVPGFPAQDGWKANESVALQNQSAHLRGSKVRSRPAWLRGCFESCPFAMVYIYMCVYTFVCLPRSRSRLAEHLLVILDPTFPSTLLLKSCRPDALSLFSGPDTAFLKLRREVLTPFALLGRKPTNGTLQDSSI